MARTKTSKAWMHEHVNDTYVNQAKAQGYRSRAAFKLLQVHEKDGLLRPGQVVVDLGSAPGSWSQIATHRVGPQGRVIALDILPMEALHGVQFIQGDFRDDAVLAELEKTLAGRQVDLVLSDMAPNMSGVPLTDQARSMHLVELALEFAASHLKGGGNFLVKVFQGRGLDEYRKAMSALFASVLVRKPDASRDRSAEFYLLGKGRR